MLEAPREKIFRYKTQAQITSITQIRDKLVKIRTPLKTKINYILSTHRGVNTYYRRLQMNRESDITLLNVSDSTSNANDQIIFDASHCSYSNNNNSIERSDMTTYQKELVAVDNFYQQLKELMTISPVEIPNGKYTVSVVAMKLKKTTDGYLQLVWTLKIIKGKLEESVIEQKNIIVSTGESLKQLIKNLAIFGVSINNITELDNPNFFNQFIGRKLEIQIQQKIVSYSTTFLKVL